MTVTPNDVFRRFLVNVLEGRFATRSAMAEALGTSRSALNLAIQNGRMTADHLSALAPMMGGTTAVFRELAVLAEKLERGKIEKVTEDQESVEEMVRSPLPGRRLRGQASAEAAGTPVDAPSTETGDDRPAPHRQRSPRHDQSAKPTR